MIQPTWSLMIRKAFKEPLCLGSSSGHGLHLYLAQVGRAIKKARYQAGQPREGPILQLHPFVALSVP